MATVFVHLPGGGICLQRESGHKETKTEIDFWQVTGTP